MIKTLEKKPILTVIAVVLLMLILSIGVMDITIMEARNYVTAREMVTDGNWFLTTMNGEPRYQKPPLPTWFAAVFGWIFGLKNLLVLRLPGIIMVALTGLFSYLLSKTLIKDKKQSLVNALITVTSFYVVGIIIEAPWDIFTHGFMLVAIFHLFLLFEKTNQYWRHTILAGIFIGFSIMSKGPISFYALLLPFLIAYGVVYKYKRFKAKLFSVFSIIILFLIVGGWWYLFVRLEDPETFLKIASKETGNWGSYNTRPFYYYWSFFTQSGIWTIPAFVSLLYPYLKSRVINLKAYRFSLLWTLTALLLLSIIPEKKSRYLMPVLIPLAINTGFYIEYLIREFKSLRNIKETIPVYFNFGVIGLLGMAFPVGGYLVLKDKADVNWIMFILASIILFSIGTSLFVNLKLKRIKQIFFLCIAFMMAAFIFALPLSASLKPDNKNSVSTLHSIVKNENLHLYSIGKLSPETIWEFGQKIPEIRADDSLFPFPKESSFGILCNDIDHMDMEGFEERYKVTLIDTFDLNRKEPGSRGYRNRMINYYYVLSPKR
jgi:4-amino-4-deoxy-L-arabinose transferase-like glycosyltransferase